MEIPRMIKLNVNTAMETTGPINFGLQMGGIKETIQQLVDFIEGLPEPEDEINL